MFISFLEDFPTFLLGINPGFLVAGGGGHIQFIPLFLVKLRLDLVSFIFEYRLWRFCVGMLCRQP